MACSTATPRVKTDLAPAGATPTLDTSSTTHRGFCDARRCARLCRAGPPRHELPRRSRHLSRDLSLSASCARTRWRMRGASSRLGLKPGDRVALVAETGPEFAACFFGAVYAGAVAGPAAAADQLRRTRSLCRTADGHAEQQRSDSCSSIPPELADFCGQAAAQARRHARATGIASARSSRSPPSFRRQTPTTSPISNIRAARRASRTASRSRIARCSTICARTASASRSRDTDRCISWLPWYHDMGLVGCMLSPIATAAVGRLSEDRGFRAPSAGLARHDHAQSGHDASAIRRRSATTSARAG